MEKLAQKEREVERMNHENLHRHDRKGVKMLIKILITVAILCMCLSCFSLGIIFMHNVWKSEALANKAGYVDANGKFKWGAP